MQIEVDMVLEPIITDIILVDEIEVELVLHEPIVMEVEEL